MSEKMHYFRPVAGRVAKRFGTPAFIGARRSPTGFVINPDVVVAIPDKEIAPHRKSYLAYIRRGDLKTATKAEYDTYLDARRAKAAAAEAAAAEADEAAPVEEATADAPAEEAAPKSPRRRKRRGTPTADAADGDNEPAAADD